MVVFQRILPSARLMQSRWRLRLVISPGSRDDVANPVKQVRYTRPLCTMGLEAPGPGSVAFQTTLLLSPQVSGSPGASLWPRAPSPRNCGHSARADICVATASQMVRRVTARFEPADR